MRKSVLVLARQAELRAAVARVLLPTGFRVEVASSEKMARQFLRKERFAAAVIAPASASADDLMFLREAQNGVGKLVLLTENAGAFKTFAGSFPRALVCSSQPLEADELLEFLETTPKASSRDTTGEPGLAHFEGCTLDMAGRIFLDANRHEVTLTRGEFALLVAFVRNPGRVLSRAQLRDAIDGRGAEAYDRSVDMLVARLRRKIEPNAAKMQFIVTVPGSGYKFVPRVRDGQPEPVSPEQPATRLRPHTAQSAQRRQLTVLSCQILGFAALAAKLDPEDLEEVIRRVYKACAEIIGHFDGTVVRTLGDGVLGYFGHPQAQENSAESAVRAALELLGTIGGIEAAPIGRFRARAGIATGVVIIGELSSGAREPTIVGEALNLALHMQNAAPADSVVIAASTRELVGRFFHCREFGPVVVEEGHEPEPAWRVIDEIAGMPRFEALRRDGMLEFVGREAEIERLVRHWSAARGGAGQVVVLKGEPGIGKSRLAAELEERLRTEAHATIRYSGSQHRTDAPMWVLLDELQRSADFAADDTAAQKLEKLHRYFEPCGIAAKEATALVGALLRIPFKLPPEIRELAPQKSKERIFAALLTRMERMASRQPVLAIVEDVHWVDPTSLEFLALLVERTATLRLLLMIVGRPEFVPPWADHSYVATLALSRLSRSDSITIMHQVAGSHPVPASVEAEILSRADGVPLFVEELTKSEMERRANGDSRRPARESRPESQSIPTTLHGLLLTRFDRLERGKEVAQAGAVIGREFSLELLRMISGMDGPKLAAALDQLVSSGLVFRRGSSAQATFAFKHALVRDAAYDMLPRDRRRDLHARIAQVLESNFPDTLHVQPELLAYHHREAGHVAKAITYLVAAAERSWSQSALVEARAHIGRALELLSTQDNDAERERRELAMLLVLRRILVAQMGYTAPATIEALARARELCEALNDQAQLPGVIYGQWGAAWAAAAHATALEHARAMLQWGERAGNPAGKTYGHFTLGVSLMPTGALSEARKHLEAALALDEFEAAPLSDLLSARATVAVRPTALLSLHNCLFLLGWPTQAEQSGRRAVSEVESISHLYARAIGLNMICRMYALRRDAHRLSATAAALFELSNAEGYPPFAANGMVYRGWSLALNGGTPEESIALVRSGIAHCRAMGFLFWLSYFLVMLAECHAKAGDLESALQALAEAAEMVEHSGERFWESELHRLRAKLLGRAGRSPQEVEDCLVQALEISRRQEARLLQLRAATSLAEFHVGQSRKNDARNALAPIYNWFVEGFETDDLKNAKAVLHRLQ